MKNHGMLFLFCLAFVGTAVGQRSDKLARYFADPVLTDSLSTLFFPTQYNEGFLSTNKIALWGSYYANIVVYNFLTDSSIPLFAADTYIEAFRRPDYMRITENTKIKNITNKWVFLLVKSKDYNDSGRIDGNDPSILYAATTKGEGLRPLTNETENVVSFEFFEKQGFGLIKIQRDSDKDFSFKNNDADFYFRKIDLENLTLGKPIEAKR